MLIYFPENIKCGVVIDSSLETLRLLMLTNSYFFASDLYGTYFLRKHANQSLIHGNSRAGLVEDRMVVVLLIVRPYPGPMGTIYRLPIPRGAQIHGSTS
jgi:hypothetical protein